MKHKTLYIGYGFSALSLIVFRVCQVAFTIESNTGFYKPQYENLWLVSAAVIIISVAAITLFSFSDIDFNCREKEGRGVAALTVVVGIAFLIKAFATFSQNAGLMALLLTLLAILSAGVCFVNAYSVFCGKSVSVGSYALIVPFWIIELVFTFIQNNDVSSVPHRFYEIITVALCLVFSLNIAKDKAGMLTQISSKIMVSLSLAASLFCLALSVPDVVLFLAGKGNLLHDASVLDLLYLAYGVYIPTYIFTTFKLKKV
ncbi:MAG: hypothetical protein IKV36_03070 [Clostridia bacterium]|nr:hypothetical protein [Clostridia bacterium]